MKVRVSLSDADSSRCQCEKPECSTGSNTWQRHHVRNQSMWLGIWSGRRKGEKKFEAFVERYHEFRREDVRILCHHHHAEIHSIYDKIIRTDLLRTRRPLSQYSWTQANRLMAKFEAAFDKWIVKVTPGIDSELYGIDRKMIVAPRTRRKK